MSDIDSNDGAQASSTRPYLVRALHDWCTDNGFTPYIAVYVDRSVQVPMEYVKNNEIVLNVSFDATSGLKLGNEYVEFRARFGGTARDIVVPTDHVIAIYARENGQGMAFPVPAQAHVQSPEGEAEVQGSDEPAAPLPTPLKLAPVNAAPAPGAEPPVDAPEPPPAGGGAKPALKRVK